MFGTIIEIVGAGIGAILLYQVFVSDAVSETWNGIMDKRKRGQQSKERVSASDKIAKVKMVSTDIKDVEKFIMDNAKDLSDDVVVKLVSHIESLRADQDIFGDMLKTKIDGTVPDRAPSTKRKAS
jgi:hypothetical protein